MTEIEIEMSVFRVLAFIATGIAVVSASRDLQALPEVPVGECKRDQC